MTVFETTREELKSHAEEEFARFNAKIVRSAYPMLGVRTPTLKSMAKKRSLEYLESEPKYYEEVLLGGFILGHFCKTADELLPRMDGYIRRVDNWAAVDSPLSSMKAFKKDPDKGFAWAKEKAFDHREFHARFGAVAMLDYYTDETHIDEVLDIYSEIESGRYYVDMAAAWGLSVAAVRFFDKTYERIAAGKYSTFVTNKAIDKCRDSFRISPENKQKLKELKIN